MSTQDHSVLAVHQYTPSISLGDGVSQGVLFTQRLLRRMGIHSEIFAHEIPQELVGQVQPAEQYSVSEEQVLLVHHAIGHCYGEWLAGLAGKKFMVYHNITPAHFFADNDPIQPLLAQGREQLIEWQSWLEGGIGDSPYNSEELLEVGFDFDCVATIPLLVDLEQLQRRQPDKDLMRQLSQEGRPLLLFVGRLTENKRQAFLIEMMHHLKKAMPAKALPKLYLVGGGDPTYQKQLRRQVARYQLENDVVITGKVSEAALTSYYLSAEAFVCASQHEGFGMPLIEAMYYDLPVLAMNYGAIASTLGNAGLLLAQSLTAWDMASLVSVFLQRPVLRSRLILSQRENLQRFEPAKLYQDLAAFLHKWQIVLPEMSAKTFESVESIDWRVEGPFDSSYSLALLNRELALALEQLKPGSSALLSTEGGGDFAPNPHFLAERPEVDRLWQRDVQPAVGLQASLRLLYPPRVTGMSGLLRVMANYGWEESVFPAEFRSDFNHKLNLVTTMSSYVSKVLQESGVSTPVKRIGVGVDHIERVRAQPLASEVLDAIKDRQVFLHISSCFPRKGVDVLLQAWGKAFCYGTGTAEPQVILVIKTFSNPHNDTSAQLKALQAELLQQGLQLAPVLLIEEDWNDGQIKSLYQHSDLLVAPSRGEGFGLPMAEAMWLGVPVIATAYGGQSDFCRSDNSWLLDYRFARAKTHMQQAGSVWVEPCVEHLTDLLTGFYHQPGEDFQAEVIQQRITNAKALIQKEFCWKHVAERLNRALVESEQSVMTAPAQDQSVRLGWISTWNSKCGIAAYSAFLLQPMANPESALQAAINQSWVLANSDAELINAEGDVLECRGQSDANQRVVRCWQAGGDLGEEQLDPLYDTICKLELNQVVIQFNFSFFDLDALKQLLVKLRADRVKVMICFHSTADVYWGEVKKSLLHLMPELQQVERILVHSCSDLNRLKEWGVVENCMLFPHGVSVPDLSESMAGKGLVQGADIRAKVPDLYRRLQGKTVIACYGFMLPHKGIETLIDSFAILTQKQGRGAGKLHLLLVNALYPAEVSSELLEQCRAKVAGYGLGQEVTFVSDFLPEEECLAWLKKADVIVFPYQHTQESSSAAVRTGLASGQPVLCTPLDIFEDVEQAVNFLPGISPEEIALGLQETLAMLANSEEARVWQQRRQLWLRQHHWPELAQRMTGILNAFMQR